MALTFIKDAAAFAQDIVKSCICGRGKRTNDPVTPAAFDKGGVYGNGCCNWCYGRLCTFARCSTPCCVPVCP